MCSNLDDEQGPPLLSRRSLLSGAIAGLVGAAWSRAAFGSDLPATRTLWVHHGSTREAGTATYMVNGRYDEGALAALDWFMRDWRENQMVQMDRRIYDVLWVIQQTFPSGWPIVVTSGYRSPRTNARLAEVIPGVAKNSLHLKALAIDFYVPARGIEEVSRYLHAWNFGGIGIYRRHLHVDVGLPGRRWVRV